MAQSDAFYEQMRKYEFLFIFSDQTKQGLHIYATKDNPDKTSLCKWILKINLSYNPGTEPGNLDQCDTCWTMCSEYMVEQSKKEVREQIPTILTRKRKALVPPKIPNDLSVDERLALTIIQPVSISDPRYPSIHGCRYICTYCQDGIDNEKQEPCTACLRMYHDDCRDKMIFDFYRYTRIHISKRNCTFCSFYVLSTPSIRPVILTHFVKAQRM